MRARIIRIGNSKGVRIPKVMLSESGLGTEVELLVADEGILIRPAKLPRENWEEAFRGMSDDEADELVIEERSAATSFEKESWRW